MAVDVLDRLDLFILPKDYDSAASVGLQNTEHFLGLLSQSPLQHKRPSFFTASELQQAVSRLDRCGHARFRRAPGGSSYTNPPEASLHFRFASNVGDHGELKVQACPVHASGENVSTSKPDMYTPLNNEQRDAAFDAMGRARMMDTDPAHVSTSKMEQAIIGTGCHMDDGTIQSTHDLPSIDKRHHADLHHTRVLQPPTATGSSFMSSLSTEGGTVTNTTLAKQSICSGRPPLPPKKRKPVEQIKEPSTKRHRSRTCHCIKHRKSKSTRVVRMSAIGLEAAEIPADGHSWRKYGQKSTEGSATTRGYYRCSSFDGCPARKHIERALDDPNIFIVTYGRNHVHLPSPMACA